MKCPALRFQRFGFDKDSLESWLGSKDTAKHALADAVLEQIGTEKTMTFLLATIKAEERRRRQRGWRNVGIVYGGLLAVQIGMDALLTHSHHFSVMGFAGGCTNAAIHGGVPSRLHRHCVERLAKIEDKRTFPALVAALVSPYRIAGNIVAQRLTRMLPGLEAEDFATLPKAHQKLFFGFINPNYARSLEASARRELARALLLAVTRLGEGDALSVTKKVANAKLKADEDDLLRRTAQNCLPLLEKAKTDQKAAETKQRLVLRR